MEMMVVVGCAAAIAITIGLWSARRGTDAAAAAKPGPPVAVRLRLTSEPAGALVYRSGRVHPLGRTPLTVTMTPSDEPLGLDFRFPDGSSHRVRTVPLRSMRIHAAAAGGAAADRAEPPGDG
jgi:hypothetical protein